MSRLWNEEHDKWARMEARRQFVKWLDHAIGFNGVWCREHRVGLEIRIKMFLEQLESRGWSQEDLEKERDRLHKHMLWVEEVGE